MKDIMKSIEFFFDFTSPYAYLAHSQLPALADKYGYRIAYKPIDLFAAKHAAGNTGPASIQIPPKFRYVTKDLRRWAQKYGVPFVMPAAPAAPADASQKPALSKVQIDSSRAHKGLFYAIEQGRDRDYVTGVWRATYGSGGLIGDDEVLRGAVRELGWSPNAFFDFVNSDKATRLYEEGNQEAHRRGVFGVPVMMIGDEMWWGNDRLILLDEYLAAHPAR
jgi:2-hydroxychromene-2-carboxylate isomerase